MALSPEDPHSYSRPDLAVVTDIHFDLYVDFYEKILKGKAILSIEKQSSTTEVILDSYTLIILSVTDFFTRNTLEYQIGHFNGFGSKFTIQLPQSVGDNTKCKIQIEYETSHYSPALHWLNPEQTAYNRYPFLLSNSKLIYARAMFPCQDTPSVKFTYSAKIWTPVGYRVIMSALLEKILEISHQYVHEFYQPSPVSSYAVCIVVGALKRERIGPRSCVWAEKVFLDQSVGTFAEIDSMLQIAEKLCGYYFWGVFDICVLPPSAADFKIECPGLTFVSPTFLGGDRSLISLIARNISQCWTGHLVTCANYEHLWLNKSFNSFIYRKIIGTFLNQELKLYLEAKAYSSLKSRFEHLGNTGLLKSLLPNLTGLLPDDVIMYVPYEKGYMLLNYLQSLLGGATVFEPFLKSYLDKFAFKSIKTDTWKEYLYHYFSDKIELLNSLNWDMWFNELDLPPSMPYIYNITLINAPYRLAKAWTILHFANIVPSFQLTLHSNNMLTMSDLQKIEFLIHLYASRAVLPMDTMRSMSYLYQFDRSNCEIRFKFLRLCIKSRLAYKVEEALRFVIRYSASRFACPIFRDLYEWQDMRILTIQTYIMHMRRFLYKTQEQLELILHLN